MIPLNQILKNAFRIRCPKCGEGKLFVSYGNLVDFCGICHLPIKAREPDTWFFMYMSTAAITGAFILSMLLLPPPKNPHLGAALIGFGAIGLFVVSTPLRKSLALAIEYFTDSRSEFPRFPEKE